MLAATATLIALGAYLAIGAVFGVAFAFRLVDRVDPAARGAGWGFRLLIVPGAAALWPWLLIRARRTGGETARQRRAHLWIWLALGPLLLGAAVALTMARPARPVAPAPVEAAP